MALKTNSKKVLDVYAQQQKKNATQAYKQIYPNASDVTARTNAYKLMNKPESKIYLQQHIDKARETIVDLLQSEKDDIKLRSAIDILDRTQGKAVQRTEVNTSVLTLNIDLTQADITPQLEQ